jgi:hypothetical protein
MEDVRCRVGAAKGWGDWHLRRELPQLWFHNGAAVRFLARFELSARARVGRNVLELLQGYRGAHTGLERV